MKNVLVMMGLPASGKTTYAKDYYRQKNKVGYYSNKCYRVNHINFDELFESYRYNKYDKPIAIERIIKDNVSSSYDEIILDGLFLTNEDLMNILNEVDNRCKIEKIEIHYWKPNIDNCLWNDKYRREEHSEITIKNAKVEVPCVDELKKEFQNIKVEIIKHEVLKRPTWKVFADKYDIELNEDGKMGSKNSSWCLGGSYQNCWGTGGSVSADEQPTTYEAFDTLLEKVCPNITFLQYKKLYSRCVNIETYTDRDYYGGSTEHAYFECDVQQLYEGLVELGFMSEESI